MAVGTLPPLRGFVCVQRTVAVLPLSGTAARALALAREHHFAAIEDRAVALVERGSAARR